MKGIFVMVLHSFGNSHNFFMLEFQCKESADFLRKVAFDFIYIVIFSTNGHKLNYQNFQVCKYTIFIIFNKFIDLFPGLFERTKFQII